MTRISLRYLVLSLFLFPGIVFATSNVGGNRTAIEQLQDRISEKKEAVAEIEQSIEVYKKRIREKRLESASLSNQVAILDNRKAQVELDIGLTENRLDTITLELESLDLAIEDKEETIVKQQDIIAEMIRTIHYSDAKKYIEIAAAYDSFSDFYNPIQYVQRVEKSLGQSVRGLRIAQAELQDKHEQAENKQEAFVDLQEELAAKRDSLDEQQYLKQDLLGQTKSSERQFQTLLDSLRGQYQQIENEIAGIERDIRRQLEANDRLSGTGDPSQLSWPTQSRYITARFHDPDYPYRHVFEHNAIDIRSAQGTPLKAAASGYVARAKRCSLASCYSYVMLVHSGGISTVYGHMSRIAVSEDQFVTRGDVIGYSGGTPGTVGAGPFVTGPHLHFEVRKDGIPVNPLNYLIKDY